MLRLFVALFAFGLVVRAEDSPPVKAPPETFFSLVSERDREAARGFYKKYIDVGGMPVVAAAEVDDAALQRTHWIVTHLLAGRPDIVEAMIKNRMYLIVIGRNQRYTDMPEYSHAPNAEYLNERVRGTGGRPTSFGEENVLSLSLDRYDDESIGVHEFCHTIDGALRSIDATWSERRNAVYKDALAKGLWKNTYAASNPGEFWAEICQSYFDCNRTNNWNHGPIGRREELKDYDPESYELVRTTFKLEGDKDWRYAWAQKLPKVEMPPAKFQLDPYYTKFTWAREFTALGHTATDEGLLKANEMIRKMFAYRHDLLKTLINNGTKLVVVGRGEKITDFPADTNRIVVTEVSVQDTIFVMAKAFYLATAHRPVDENWDKRRDVQQYELRVTRLDERFGAKVQTLYEKSPMRTRAKIEEYWARAVQAYFSELREKMRESEPDLYALIHETMAYEGHPDWRLEAYH